MYTTGNSFFDVLGGIFMGTFIRMGTYIPQFFAGLVILIVGLVVAALLHKLVVEFFRLVHVGDFLEEAKITKAADVRIWQQIFAEFVRWTVIILFLVPAAEVWGIPNVTNVLNQLLLYIPNVFVAVIVGLVGMVAANIMHDVVAHGAKGLGSTSAHGLATFSRYAIIFFTVLVVLNQLGIAADLIRILFTGIVAMLAIAGGLAFGLGGQDEAKQVLKSVRGKLEGKEMRERETKKG